MQLLRFFVLFLMVVSTADLRAADIVAPQPGTPLRQSIMDDLRAAEPTASTQKEKKQKIIFEMVTLRVAGEWAWFSVSPRTQDGQWRSEPLNGLLHRSGGHWKVVEYVSDDVPSADDPQKAYDAWRAKLLKKNPQCPSDLVPKKG